MAEMNETNQKALLMMASAIAHATIHQLWRTGLIPDETVRAIYADALEQLEHGVRTAGDDRSAIDLARRLMEGVLADLHSGPPRGQGKP